LLETGWKAKQSVLAAEKERIDYEIKNSTGATREEWEHKLVLWRRKAKLASSRRNSVSE